MKNKKDILSFLLTALFIFLAFGSLFESKDEKKTYMPDSDGSIKISAVRLYQEYLDNPVAADEKFKGKMLKVDGTVSLITQETDGRISILLEANVVNGFVFCYFPYSQSNKISKLEKGSYKTFRGRCTGKLVGVVMEDCEVY
jgi:hypothetical protein